MKTTSCKKAGKVVSVMIGTALLSCIAALGVACTKDDRPEATLTFIEGIDGNTTSFTRTAKVGDTLSGVLEGITPAAVEDLEFGGWFANSVQVDGSTTVTAEGLTLTAKYLAEYSLSSFTQNKDGVYGEAVATTGKSWYGEPFSLTAPEHYTFTAQPEGVGTAESKVSVERLGKSEQFVAYLALDNVTAVYHLNPPEAAGGEDKTLTQTVYYGGGSVTKAAEDFGVSMPETCRFAGWAASENGEVVYDAAEALDPDSDIELFAKWDVAKADVFGGSDMLFVSSEKGDDGAVILVREGLGEKRGTVNESGVFTFSEGEEIKLDGKIVGDEFYYFLDVFENEYAAYDGTAAKMQLKAHGEAVYTPAEGEAVNGTYEIDLEKGIFVFHNGGGSADSFVFNVVPKDDELLFRTVAQEEGYYALKTEDGYDYDLIYFDGMGMATYLMKDLETDEVSTIEGEYELTDGETNTYAVTFYGDGTLNVAIRLEAQTGTLDGHELKGVYLAGDEYAGTYTIGDYWSGEDVYVLDGFGAGTKNGTPATYTVEQTEPWLAIQDDSVYEVAAFWVKFTTQDGAVTVLDFVEDYYNNTVAVEVAANSLFGKYEIEGVVAMNGMYYDDGFLLVETTYSGGMHGYLWFSSQLEDGTVAYVQADEGSVFASYGVESEYRFQNTNYQTYTFTVNAEKVRFTNDAVTIFEEEAGTLILDANGEAQYTPAGGTQQKIEYSVEEGVAYVYTFHLTGGDRRFILENGYSGTTAKEITADKVYDVGYLTEERTNEYTARLLVISENEAILGLLLNDGAYYYCFYGTFSQNTDGDYGFAQTNSLLPTNGYEGVYDEYGYFLFKTETVDGVNYFYQYDEAISITCAAGTLVTDGYSVATYTPAGGTPITGTYYYDANFVFIKTDTETIKLRVTDPETFELAGTEGSELGYYFTIDDVGNVSDQYFFLDGSGTVLLYSSSNTQWGTYEATGKTINGYPEYCLTFKVTVEEAQETLNFYVVTIVGPEYNVYVMRNDTQYCKFDIYKNGVKTGELEGDGYLDAFYAIGEDEMKTGMIVRCNVLDGDYTQELDFEPALDGACVLFAETDSEGEILDVYLFDLVDGKAVLRTLEYGTYGYYEQGEADGTYIRLDGHGAATLYNAEGTATATGSYDKFPELGEDVYRFTAAEGTESFVFTIMELDGQYFYSKYTEKKVYANADWSALVLDGFGGAVYIDRYGVRTEGDEIDVAQEIKALRPYGYGETLYFTFEDGACELVTGDWVVVDGVVYLYVGESLSYSNSKLTMPEGATEIAEGALRLCDIGYLRMIDLKDVTKIGANVFAGSALESVSSEKLLTVGAGAFKNCDSLETVELPKVTSIGAEAFSGCTSLESVVLEAIKEIGANAFTRPSYSSMLTEFDLTAAENFATIEFDATAFNNSADALISMKITVASIEALNAIYATDWASEIKASARIANQSRDSMNEAAYADLMTGNVYSFTNGAITKDVRVNDDYAEENRTMLSLYYIDAEGSVIPYSQVDGVWTAGTAIDTTQANLTLDGVTLWADSTDYTFTDEATGKDIVFSLTIYGGSSPSVSVQQYDFSFDGESVSGFSYNVTQHKFTFTLADGVYEATITGVGTYTAVKTKELLTLEYVPDGTVGADNPKFRILFALTNDGKTSIEKVEKDTEGYYSTVDIVSAIEGDTANVFTLVIADGDYQETYTVTYTPASGEAQASVSVTLVGKVAGKNKVGSVDYNWQVSFTYTGTKLLGCTYFANWESNLIEYTILNVVVNDDGTLDLTARDDQGAERTFKLEYAKNAYGNATVNVTETTGTTTA